MSMLIKGKLGAVLNISNIVKCKVREPLADGVNFGGKKLKTHQTTHSVKYLLRTYCAPL